MITSRKVLLLSLITQILCSTNASSSNNNNIFQKIRKTVDISTLFYPIHKRPSYDRILSTPAFAVTTSWGSPYMIFERLSRKEALEEEEVDNVFGSSASLDRELEPLSDTKAEGSEGDDDSQSQRTRTCALYFMDPDDAKCLCDEMKQMGGGMGTADVRVLSTSLGRAVRQSSIISPRGLPTGQPLDDTTGRLRSDQGQTLRYKIVPSKRELYYAARCIGKESVGLFSNDGLDDIKEILTGKKKKSFGSASGRASSAPKFDARERMEQRRMAQQKGKNAADSDAAANDKQQEQLPLKQVYAHMQGKTGIPVFYLDGLKLKPPRLPTLSSLFSKNKKMDAQIPLFFSYEDVVSTWKKQSTNTTASVMPQVQVFNFMDVLVSLDKKQYAQMIGTKKGNFLNNLLNKKNNIVSTTTSDDDDVEQLKNVVFIPSSRSISYKESTSLLGNCKARLRPMR